jgi:hypothetical protein
MFAVATYALTYPQLMNQALSCDLSESDLLQLRSAHEFAQLFADGIYRAQDAPLLSHLVRTASILLAERQPVSVVLAGLLHAAYTLQYFDGSVRASCPAFSSSITIWAMSCQKGASGRRAYRSEYH